MANEIYKDRNYVFVEKYRGFNILKQKHHGNYKILESNLCLTTIKVARKCIDLVINKKEM